MVLVWTTLAADWDAKTAGAGMYCTSATVSEKTVVWARWSMTPVRDEEGPPMATVLAVAALEAKPPCNIRPVGARTTVWARTSGPVVD